MSAKLHHTSFFTAKFKCSPRSTKTFHGFARGIVISDIVFGCGDPKYNPSPETRIEFANKICSGFATLQFFVSEKQCKGASSCMALPMSSDELTNNPSPSNS